MELLFHKLMELLFLLLIKENGYSGTCLTVTVGYIKDLTIIYYTILCHKQQTKVEL